MRVKYRLQHQVLFVSTLSFLSLHKHTFTFFFFAITTVPGTYFTTEQIKAALKGSVHS
jgi:hypothetical protein